MRKDEFDELFLWIHNMEKEIDKEIEERYRKILRRERRTNIYLAIAFTLTLLLIFLL